MDKRFLGTVLVLILCIFFSSITSAFQSSPLGYLQRVGGSDIVGASSGILLLVVENPSNSGEPVTKIEISIPSGFTVGSGVVYVLGRGYGNVSDVSGPVVVNFSQYLMPGSKAYVYLKSVQNPSTAGSYTWFVTAYGVGNNSTSVLAYPDKSFTTTIVSSLGFRSIPYGRIVLDRGNAAAATGIKQVSIANTFWTYIIYNPYDSGESISELKITIPSAYATVAGTTIVVSNLLSGTQLASITPGAIGAGVQKNITLSLSPSAAPGSILTVTFGLLTSPAAAGNYTWECYVKGAVSGQLVKVLDMPGFANSQVANIIAAPAAGWYADVYLFYDNISKTIGWPTTGSSNNVYRIVEWRTTAWGATSDPVITFPSGYSLSSSGVTNRQANGAGVGSVFLVGNSISNDITAAGAVNNNIIFSVTNVVNTSTPGSSVFSLTVGDGVGVLTTAGYDRTVTLVSHLFTNIPSFGVDVISGTTNTNDNATYLVVVSNPTNSGDAIDRITIQVPTGYSNVDVDWANVSYLNSGAVLDSSNIVQPGSSVGTIDLFFRSDSPLGEGATMYIPISLINPSNAGTKIWNVKISGLRDVTNIDASILPNMTNRITIVAASLVGDGTNYVPTNAISTNKSSDDFAWLVVTNGTFSDTAIVSISKVTNYPAPTSLQSNNYVFIGNVYDFSSSLAPSKPMKLRIYYSNNVTNFVSSTNNLANLKLAYYDLVSSSWVVNLSSIVNTTDGYVETETLNLGKWWIWEVRSSGAFSNAFSVGKVSGGTVTYNGGKIKIDIPSNALVEDATVIVDVLSSYPSLPNYFVKVSDVYDITCTSALNSSATVSIYYTDEEVKGRVIDRLRLAFYNKDTKEWVVVPSVVDKENKRVYTKTLHFSQWILVEDRTPTSDLVSSVYIYPTPAKDNLKVSFVLNEMSKVDITIYDVSGKRVKSLSQVYENGLVEIVWNLRNDLGNSVLNGPYLVKLSVKSTLSDKSFSQVYKVIVGR